MSTYSIGEVGDQILDGQGPGLELVIQPKASHRLVSSKSPLRGSLRDAGGEEGLGGRREYHLVKVFCCTLIHCFSTVNMLTTFRADCREEVNDSGVC